MNLQIYFAKNKTDFPELDFYDGYLILLTQNNWDDFGYKVTFDISIIDYSITPKNAVKFGEIKIAVSNAKTSSTIDEVFFADYFTKSGHNRLVGSLPIEFYSVPEYNEYYSKIENYFCNNENTINLFYQKTRDVLKNNIQPKVVSQDIFKKAFQRTFTFSSHEEFEWILHGDRNLNNFLDQLTKVDEIINSNFSEKIIDEIYIMVHAHLISILENYLSFIFIKTVMSNNELILKQAKYDGKIKDLNFKLVDVARGMELVKDKVRKSLEEMSFHNVNTVIPLFRTVLGCNIDDLSWLSDAVIIRHTCVHRAGFDRNGSKVYLTKEGLIELKENIIKFVSNIQNQVRIQRTYLNISQTNT